MPAEIKAMPPSFEPWEPKLEPSRRIAVMMSGGVDSSVTAHILKEAGWEVLGITMKIPVACDAAAGCCGVDAAFVCDKLGITHYFLDTTDVFNESVIEKFRSEYAAGRTPNPCVDCNSVLKFERVWSFIEEHFGVSNLATGHYARVRREGGKTYLCKADDNKKDQSYFLYGIRRERLEHLYFPLADIEKTEVRRLAAEIGLHVSEKPESMELCFAGHGDYRSALDPALINKPGKLTDMSGNVLAEHSGIANYTLGQRRGLGFAAGEPRYVGRIDASTNTVSIGTREEVCFKRIRAAQFNVLVPEKVFAGAELAAKIRSYSAPKSCRIIALENGEAVIEFAEPLFAPTPGQKVVFYDDDVVLAGGTIILIES
jgi:tRNA-specific 2-thiouridylase